LNKHLNIFIPYSKEYRTYQLENDLTRALAITLTEDSLFFHEFLKKIFEETPFYGQLFDSMESNIKISIEIQKNTKDIKNFDHIFAISLSESKLKDFWGYLIKNNNYLDYEYICDLTIKINKILLIIEIKRDDVNCTEQLFYQIKNICKKNKQEVCKKIITAYDLNWEKLLKIAIRVLNFERSFNKKNTFLYNFIQLIESHNRNWLPETPINSLNPKDEALLKRRIESAINKTSKQHKKIEKLDYNDRLGISFPKKWANEILFNFSELGDLEITIYPGNTKGQGYKIFNNKTYFSEKIQILNKAYDLEKKYHIKFTSFQRYFSGLWFEEKDLKKELYTKENYYLYTGRIKKERWKEIEFFLDDHFKKNFNWKALADWNSKVINSGKTQFDISFGYQIYFNIPFNDLKAIDKKQKDIQNLSRLILEIFTKFQDNLLNFK